MAKEKYKCGFSAQIKYKLLNFRPVKYSSDHIIKFIIWYFVIGSRKQTTLVGCVNAENARGILFKEKGTVYLVYQVFSLVLIFFLLKTYLSVIFYFVFKVSFCYKKKVCIKT